MCRKLTEFYQQSRYKLNKTLLSYNGQWPYQEPHKRNFLVAFTLSFAFFGLPGQIRKVIVYRGDWSIIIPAMGPILVHAACVVKILNSLYYADKMRLLLEQIYDDWHSPMGPERMILEKFADDGRLFTLIYTVWLYTSTISFLLLSNVPHILAVNGWKNMSSATAFIIPVYYTDHDELSDSESLDIDLHPRHTTDKTFWTVVDCINKHKAAIQYADLLDSAFSWSFLILLGCNMLSMSFTGLQVLIGANPDSLDEAIRQAVFAGSQLLHLLFENAFSQRLTDHSFDVFVAITKSKWYSTSLRTRKLLIFMLMRSLTPWELKAGKIVPMSMETFSSIVRNSLSYLTILSSME